MIWLCSSEFQLPWVIAVTHCCSFLNWLTLLCTQAPVAVGWKTWAYSSAGVYRCCLQPPVGSNVCAWVYTGTCMWYLHACVRLYAQGHMSVCMHTGIYLCTFIDFYRRLYAVPVAPRGEILLNCMSYGPRCLCASSP